MFRILFFILICTLGFYAFWGIYSPVKELSQQQISQDFQDYLSGAIARNIAKKTYYDVRFYKKDFIDIPQRETYFKKTTTLNYYDELSYNTPAGGESVITGSENMNGTISLPPADFTSSLGGESANCDRGIIFDPCITIIDTWTANGGMDFGVYPMRG